MTHKRVLVAGATGRLGVIVDVLLDRGHSVRAMTRNPASPAALTLRAAGAEVVHGDFEDPNTIAAAAAGVDAMFATGTVHRAGPDGELRHGRNIVRAATAAGVPHLVYSSGDGAAPDSPLPLFRVNTRWRSTSARCPSRTRSSRPSTSWRTCSTRGTCPCCRPAHFRARYASSYRCSRWRSPI